MKVDPATNRAVAAARSAAGHDPDVLVKVDPATNARFFFNKTTKKSGWHLHEVSELHRATESAASGSASGSAAAGSSPSQRTNRAVAAAHSAAGHDPDVLVKVDPATNARFFFNKKTQKSGWHLHEVSANHAVPKENAIGATRSASTSSTGAPVRLADLQQGLEHAAKSPKMHPAPDAHIEEHVQSGKRFYYCTKTGRSAWHKGELLATPRHNTARAGVTAAKSAGRNEGGGRRSSFAAAAAAARLTAQKGAARPTSTPLVPHHRVPGAVEYALANGALGADQSSPVPELFRVKDGVAKSAGGTGGASEHGHQHHHHHHHHRHRDPPIHHTPVKKKRNLALTGEKALKEHSRAPVRTASGLRVEKPPKLLDLLTKGDKPTKILYKDAMPNALGFMGKDNVLRAALFKMYSSPRFDVVVMLPIFANVITLAMFRPTTEEECTRPIPSDKCASNATLESLEIYFNVAFTLELVVLVICLGFVAHKHAYLRDNWNRLDFCVVIIGWLPFMVPAIGNFTAIRALRVVKVLRTVKSIAGMRTLVASLINSVMMLVDVLYLLIFIFFIFGIIGVQLYSGSFHQQCFKPDATTGGLNLIVDGEGGPTYCASPANDSYVTDLMLDSKGFACPGTGVCRARPWSPGQHAPYHEMLASWNENPNNGFTNFDHIGFAFLTIFQCISLEGWTGVMYITMDTRGSDAAIYFVMMILLGAFFVVNLAIAVIYDSYHMQAEDQEKVDELKKQLKIEEDEAKKGHGGDLAAELRRQTRRASLVGGTGTPGGGQINSDGKDEVLDLAGLADKGIAIGVPEVLNRKNYEEAQLASDAHLTSMQRSLKQLVDSAAFEQLMTLAIVMNTVVLAMEKEGESDAYYSALEEANFYFTLLFGGELVLKVYGLGVKGYCSDSFNRFDGVIVIFSFVELLIKWALQGGSLGFNPTFLRALRLLRIFKLAKNWRTLRALCATIFKALPGLGHFSAILAVFSITFALIGVQLYGGNYTKANGFDEVPRSNFNSCFYGVLAVFQVMTGEDWNEVMYDAMKIQPAASAVLFTFMFFFGNYVMLNLFLAILLDNFSSGEFVDSIETTEGLVVAKGTEGLLSFVSMLATPAYKLCPGLVSLCSAKKERSKKKKKQKLQDSKGTKHHSEIQDDEHGITIRYAKKASGGTGGSGDGHGGPKAKAGSAGNFDSSSSSSSSSDSNSDSSDDEAAHQPTAEEIRSLNFHRSLAAQIAKPFSEGGIESCEHKVKWKTFDDCFTGEDLVAWLCDNHVADSHKEAVRVGQKLLQEQFVMPVDLMGMTNVAFACDDSLFHVVPVLRDDIILQGGREFRANIAKKQSEKKEKKRQKTLKLTLSGTSLFGLNQDSPFRKVCAAIVTSPLFEKLVFFFIFVSCAALAVMEPGEEASSDSTGLHGWVYLSDVITTLVFDIEMVLKIIAMGLYFGKDTYLKDGWNFTDAIVNVASTIDLVNPKSDLGFFKALRALRALRPLRLISRNPGMKMVVNSIILSLPTAVNVVAVIGLVFLVFGCAGIQFFRGKLKFCHESGGGEGMKYTHNRKECAVAGGTWQNPVAHFDNIVVAMMTLYEVATMEMWLDTLWACVDSPTVKDDHPVRDNTPGFAVFFMLFIIVGSLLGMNLFVGVVCDKFAELKSSLNGSAFLTVEQQRWRETQQRMLRAPTPRKLKPPIAMAELRRPIFDIVNTKCFELVLMGVIVANVLIMSLEHHAMGQSWVDALAFSNWAFIVIYTIEAVLKISGLGFCQYFNNGWNRFDLFGTSFCPSRAAALCSAPVLTIYQMLSSAFSAFSPRRPPTGSSGRLVRRRRPRRYWYQSYNAPCFPHHAYGSLGEGVQRPVFAAADARALAALPC